MKLAIVVCLFMAAVICATSVHDRKQEARQRMLELISELKTDDRTSDLSGRDVLNFGDKDAETEELESHSNRHSEDLSDDTNDPEHPKQHEHSGNKPGKNSGYKAKGRKVKRSVRYVRDTEDEEVELESNPDRLTNTKKLQTLKRIMKLKQLVMEDQKSKGSSKSNYRSSDPGIEENGDPRWWISDIIYDWIFG